MDITFMVSAGMLVAVALVAMFFGLDYIERRRNQMLQQVMQKSLGEVVDVAKLFLAKSPQMTPLNTDSLQTQVDVLTHERDVAVGSLLDYESKFNELKTAGESVIQQVTELMAQVEALGDEKDKLADYSKSLENQLASSADTQAWLASRIEELETALESTASNLADGVDTLDNASEKVLEAVNASLVEMGNPTTPYECGIYNGVVSIANTLFDTKYDLVIPPVQVHTAIPDSSIPKGVITVPKRDNKGRFLKASV